MTQSSRNDLCAICGVNRGVTRDHIPPAGIFSKPRPADLITVPACSQCNLGDSEYDEQFRVYLSMEVGTDTPETRRLWKDHSLDTLRHNQKLRKDIENSFRSIDVKSMGGIYLGQATAFRIDARAYNAVIERTIRGLYFHHYKEILGDRVTFRGTMLRSIDQKVLESSQSWPMNTIGNDAVIYKFNRAAESPLYSIWILQFYNRHWAMGSTEPIGEN